MDRKATTIGINAESEENTHSSFKVFASYLNLGVGHVTPGRRHPVCHS